MVLRPPFRLCLLPNCVCYSKQQTVTQDQPAPGVEVVSSQACVPLEGCARLTSSTPKSSMPVVVLSIGSTNHGLPKWCSGSSTRQTYPVPQHPRSAAFAARPSARPCRELQTLETGEGSTFDATNLLAFLRIWTASVFSLLVGDVLCNVRLALRHY